MNCKKGFLPVLTALISFVLLLLPATQVKGDECPHQWVMVSTTPATCTESGYEVYHCSLCTAEKKVTLPALGHVWSYCITIKKATCTEDGLIRCYCARDNTHYKDSVEPARGHTWGNWHTTKRATLNEWGISERQCSTCGETEKSKKRPLAYRESYGLTLILSPLPPEFHFHKDHSLALTQEISLINTGMTDLFIREYSCKEGISKELPQPLQLLHGQTMTLPLTCVFTVEELSLLSADDGGEKVLPLELCFYGSLDPSERVCASNQVQWEPALPADPADTSSHTLRLTQTLLSASADPAGYQLSETVRCRISVTNEGSVLLPEIRIQPTDETEPMLVQDLLPGETRDLLWSHSVTLEEAIAGYSLTTWRASWTAGAENAPQSTGSNAIVVPVTSQLDLLLDVVPVTTPNNAVYFKQGDEVCFQLRLQNNGARMISNVTVFDPFHPEDPSQALGHMAQIRPEESILLEIRYSITEEDVRNGGIRFTVTAQGYDTQGTLHTWGSGEFFVPTAAPTE